MENVMDAVTKQKNKKRSKEAHLPGKFTILKFCLPSFQAS